MAEFLIVLRGLAATYGVKILMAIVVLILGSLIVKGLAKTAGRALEKTKMDETLKKLSKKAVTLLLYLILILIIVEILGIPMTSIMALLASVGLAVGLALQGALGNLAGGLMILIFRPFKLGDYVEAAGAAGIVEDISIFYTRIKTMDNKLILVPNGELMNGNVTNYSAKEQRRVDLDFKITNDIDAELVKRVLLQAAGSTTGVLEDPAPFTRLTAVDDDTYIFTVRVWCETAQYWDVYFDLIEACSRTLRENGIDDPEERIAVRLVKED